MLTNFVIMSIICLLCFLCQGDRPLPASWGVGAIQSMRDGIAIVAQVQTMYDLTVEEAHTFAVGEGQWVVHNANGCNVPRYALGNLGDSDVVRTHNLETLDLYNPGKATVFSSVYDLNSSRWVGFPSEGTVLKTGKIPPIGFRVGREGGHAVVWDHWRQFDAQVTQRNLGESGLVGFTLFYTSPNHLGIRWTSRSINMVNWLVDEAPQIYTSVFGGEPIKLRAPVIQSLADVINFNLFDLPDTMSVPKQRP